MRNRVIILSVFLLLIPFQLAFGAPKLEIIGEVEQRPGNPAVGPDGTVYFSMHPFDKPEFKIMKLKDGKGVPYPNEEISRSYGAVIGIQATADGVLWWLDMGGENISPKLVGWNTKENKLHGVHVIPQESSVKNSFHQDFAIDEKRNRAFIADMSRSGMIDESNPAIVVVDLSTGATRRVLSGDDFFQPAKSALVADGSPMQTTDKDGKSHPIKLGLNPIAIDPDNEWIYFSTMTAGKMYRVPAKVIGDFDKDESNIRKAIEIYGDKPSSDGIAVGSRGTVYITNVDKNAISIVDKKGTRIWIADERMSWPDGAYVAPDESLVVTVNQLHRAPDFNNGVSKAEKPYFLMRITQ